MAKKTTLQMTNQILKNIGEAGALTALTSLTAIEQLCFDKLNESIVELAGLSDWLPLEKNGTATLLTGTNTYAVPTDLLREDVNSFRMSYYGKSLGYYKSPADWDTDYPKGITTNRNGCPSALMRFADYWHFNNLPTATENNKTVEFRYWQRPTLLTTATATGTCWVPEQMDDLVLVNLATYKVLAYKGSPEAMEYYQRVFGRNQTDRGNLTIMKQFYASIGVRFGIPVRGQFETQRVTAKSKLMD